MGSDRSQRVEAIVLRHLDFSEADRLLTLYTRELGKVKALAKGVRKLISRKAGHLEPFTCADILLARGRNFWIVTQAETVEAYFSIKESLLLTGYGSYALELLDRLTLEDSAHLEIYQLLKATLDRLSGQENPFLATRYFEIHLLEHLGFRPQLFQCIHCLQEIKPQNQYFSASMGGAVCPECGLRTHDSRPISMEALKYLRHLQRSRWKDAKRATIPTAVQEEMENVIQYYLSTLLERRLNSPNFIRLVKNG